MRINVKLNGKLVKYNIPDYYLQDLEYWAKLDDIKITRMIQKIVDDMLKDIDKETLIKEIDEHTKTRSIPTFINRILYIYITTRLKKAAEQVIKTKKQIEEEIEEAVEETIIKEMIEKKIKIFEKEEKSLQKKYIRLERDLRYRYEVKEAKLNTKIHMFEKLLYLSNPEKITYVTKEALSLITIFKH